MGMSLIRPRVAVVTGGSSGIGKAVATALAKDGYALAVLDRSIPAKDQEIDDLVTSGAPAARGYKFDLADIEGHGAIVDRVERELGPIDVLVNNAGVPARIRGDLLAIQPTDFDMVLGINLRGTFFLTQDVARRMSQRGPVSTNRSIITVSSVSATAASIERGEYCISKSALPMVVKLFALRLAELGIGVFEVRPGIIRTPMTEVVSGRYDGLISEGLVPMKRWGEDSDVAEAVSTLARGGLSFATGTVISVDGGLSIERF